MRAGDARHRDLRPIGALLILAEDIAHHAQTRKRETGCEEVPVGHRDRAALQDPVRHARAVLSAERTDARDATPSLL